VEAVRGGGDSPHADSPHAISKHRKKTHDDKLWKIYLRAQRRKQNLPGHFASEKLLLW
jgi:hypothetical protein